MPGALSALSSALFTAHAQRQHPVGRSRAPAPPAAAANAPVAAALSLFLVSYRPAAQRRRPRRRRRRTSSTDSGSAAESAADGDSGLDDGGETDDGAEPGGRAGEVRVGARRGGKLGDLPEVSDLRRGGARDIVVVTTAALPWMTGTAVNPLLRVMYLARDGHHVTLCVPWLEDKGDQRAVFPSGVVFKTRQEQTLVIRRWAESELPVCPHFDVVYYEGVYSELHGSILPLDDPTVVLAASPGVKRDVVVLEEPEHLTWYHAGIPWTRLFRFSVGVIHTNYLAYIAPYGALGPQRALLMGLLNNWCARAYCHRVVKLSDALQDFPHSVTCNVHGVREKFLAIGRARAASASSSEPKPFDRGAYFLGKCLWSKGYRELIDLMVDHHSRAVAAGEDPRGDAAALRVDFFGSGPDQAAVSEAVRSSPALANVAFHARVADHTSTLLQSYKVYVNASTSDVVCTATAEALAMGKTAVVLEHPSNAFFAAFPNCHTFRTPEQFSSVLLRALSSSPEPLSPADAHHLTWHAATERFYDAVRVPLSKRHASQVDLALASTHGTLSRMISPPAVDIRRAKSRDQLDVAPTTTTLTRNGTLRSNSVPGIATSTPRSALLSRLTQGVRRRDKSEPPLTRTSAEESHVVS